jgi:hypothetical protein
MSILEKQETKQKRNEPQQKRNKIKQKRNETKQNTTETKRNKKKSSINKTTKQALTKQFCYKRQQFIKCQWRIEKPLKFTGRFGYVRKT